jgi:predicted permease
MRRFLDDTSRDLRYALRVLSRSPLFSLVAICSLAIGIGGAASVFTVLNAIVLRTLPVPSPQQLYAPEKVLVSERHSRYSWPQFDDARKELAGRAELAAFIYPSSMNVRTAASGSGPVERGLVQLVSGEFFDVFRQQPQRGRLLAPSDNVTVGGHPVAVISDAYWNRQFRRSPETIGRTVTINGSSFTIVGVTAPKFFGAIVAGRNPEIWVPLMMQAAVRYASNASNDNTSDPRQPWPPQRGIEWLNVIARVPDPAVLPAISGTLTSLFQRDSRAQRTNPDEDALREIAAQHVVLDSGARGVSYLREEASAPLLVLLGMVGVLLAIACGNVASLLISRASARDREIAIRLSIGAARARVVRQLLAETLLLAIVGGGLGLLLAAWGRDLLLGMFTGGAAVVDLDARFDWRVLGFALALTFISGVLAGIGPALRGTRVELAESMKGEGRSVGAEGGRRGRLIGKSLVAAQIAFCLLLLVLAALFARSMQSLLRVDVGYDRDRVLTARLDVRSMGLPAAERLALYARIVDRVSSIPGVESASVSLTGPLGTSQRTSSFAVEGYTAGRDEQLITNEDTITDRYFETVGLRIVEGRGFGPEDRAPEARTSIINQTMAKRFFPNGGAVGRRWNYGGEFGPDSYRIIGVVEDAKYMGSSVRANSPNMIYTLAAATPDNVLSSLEVRTAMPPTPLVETVRKALASAEPALPMFDVVPLEERLDRGLSSDRVVATLTAIFGGIALLLACLGLYGTISYGVTRRVRELGVRMALGAGRGNVLWLVIREAMVLVAAGALIGVPLAYAAGRSVSALLFGVRPLDAVAYLTAAALLALVGGLAAFLPAHRASRIDPMEALRN